MNKKIRKSRKIKKHYGHKEKMISTQKYYGHQLKTRNIAKHYGHREKPISTKIEKLKKTDGQSVKSHSRRYQNTQNIMAIEKLGSRAFSKLQNTAGPPTKNDLQKVSTIQKARWPKHNRALRRAKSLAPRRIILLYTVKKRKTLWRPRK